MNPSFGPSLSPGVTILTIFKIFTIYTSFGVDIGVSGGAVVLEKMIFEDALYTHCLTLYKYIPFKKGYALFLQFRIPFP